MSTRKVRSEVFDYVSSDLYVFYRMITLARYKENIKADYIREISRELMLMVAGDYKRLCVSLPPRHSKSSLITITMPLFLIFNNPELNIVIINNTQTLSEKFGIQLREYVKEYGALFNVYLSDVKHSNSHLMFKNSDGELYNGSIRLIGAGGSITGQDCDYIIIDDPYKGFEDITPSLLQKKIDWFNTIILQRMEPQTRLCILHTRWHTMDLIGYLQKNQPDQYMFINYSAIGDDGQPLWPERYKREILEQKREEMGDRLFESIYQQKPIDASTDFFPMENISYLNSYTEPICTVRAWDIAEAQGQGNDYTVGAKLGLLTDKKSVVLIDIVRGKYGSNNLNVIRRTAQSDGAGTYILIEPGVGAAANLLYNEWSRQLTGYMVEQLKPVKSKVDRATPLQNLILDGNLIVDLQDDNVRGAFIEEFRGFPETIHDDIVDAVAHAYNFLQDKYRDSEPVASVMNLW